MNQVRALLQELDGVLHAEPISKKVRLKIGEIESEYVQTAFLPISNLGIKSVLSREKVWVILKDTHFRPPPRPTVYMVEESDERDVPQEQILVVEGNVYRILGEEVLPGCSTIADDARPIGDGFVFYPRRRKNPKIPSYFLIPPIEFRELEELREELGIDRVASVSPSTRTDQHIRAALGFPHDEAYATILIGFDNA